MSWFVPLTGDAFVGITALIVAGLLWRSQGLAVWTIGIVWHVIGIKDYIAGLQLLVADPPIESPAPAEVFFVILGVGAFLQIISIYLLSRYRSYFLG